MRVLTLIVLVLYAALPSSAALPIDLSSENWDATFAALPEDSWAVVEFFASWCGGCKHFKPAYEQAAQIISSSSHRAAVAVMRLDCAVEGATCGKFHIAAYPTVQMGRPAAFRLPSGQALEREEYAGGKENGQDVVDWMATQIGQPILRGVVGENAVATGGGTPGPKGLVQAEAAVKADPLPTQVDLVDVVSATVKAFRDTVGNPGLMKGPAAREALQDFLDLLSTAHPVRECRNGAESAEAVLARAWPRPQVPPQRKALYHTRICGMKLSQQAWGGCRGSSPGGRGYPCAMWELFHVLAANAPESSGVGVLWLTAVKGFMGNFFPCGACAKHFVDMASQDDALNVHSADDALLWSWRAHNRVNERVGESERKDGSGDPMHPKVQWPPPQLCPTCHAVGGSGGGAASEWDEAATLRFLKGYYGAGPGAKASDMGRWHMQGHRKASFDRSRRYKGRLFSSHGRMVRTVFWAVVLVAAVLAILTFCAAPPGRSGSPRPQPRFVNGKARRF